MALADVTITGSCQVTYLGIDLGHTMGGVQLKANRTFKPVLVDQYGSMPIDQILTGSDVQIITTLAEATWRSFKTAFPENTANLGATQSRNDLGADTGFSIRNASATFGGAGLLVIHPRRNAIADLHEDITIYRAASVSAITLDYKIDAQKVIQVTFEALVDESYSAGRRLGHIGYAAVS